MNRKHIHIIAPSLFPPLLFSLALFIAGIAFSLLGGRIADFDPTIFRVLRIPRALAGVAVGGGLAVAGLSIQSALANPLADPYVMGIAAAGAFGAVIGSMMHFSLTYFDSTALAFLFSMGALVGVLRLLRAEYVHTKELLLVGIMTGFFFSSLSTLALALADPASWTSSMSWLLGSLSHATLSQSVVALFANLLLTILLWLHWRPLEIIALDLDLAIATGVDVRAIRKRVFLLSSLLTAVCVSTAGTIGFVGMLVPHALRFLGCVSYRRLLPLSFLTGAGLLTLSDATARTLGRPSEIPVGVVMALIGGPLFILLMRRSREGN